MVVWLGNLGAIDYLWAGFRGGDSLPNLISLVSFCLWRILQERAPSKRSCPALAQAAEIQAKERDMAAIKAVGSVTGLQDRRLGKKLAMNLSEGQVWFGLSG